MSKLQPDIKEETYQKAISKIKTLKKEYHIYTSIASAEAEETEWKNHYKFMKEKYPSAEFDDLKKSYDKEKYLQRMEMDDVPIPTQLEVQRMIDEPRHLPAALTFPVVLPSQWEKEEKEVWEAINSNFNVICNTLYDMFENWNFCGFYAQIDVDVDELKIYYYKSDKIPCSPLTMEGVCGKALHSETAIIVPDVSKFPGHIECDSNTKSEIAISFFFPEHPTHVESPDLEWVLDIDSKELDDFDEIDEKYLKEIIDMNLDSRIIEMI